LAISLGKNDVKRLQLYKEGLISACEVTSEDFQKWLSNGLEKPTDSPIRAEARLYVDEPNANPVLEDSFNDTLIHNGAKDLADPTTNEHKNEPITNKPSTVMLPITDTATPLSTLVPNHNVKTIMTRTQSKVCKASWKGLSCINKECDHVHPTFCTSLTCVDMRDSACTFFHPPVGKWKRKKGAKKLGSPYSNQRGGRLDQGNSKRGARPPPKKTGGEPQVNILTTEILCLQVQLAKEKAKNAISKKRVAETKCRSYRDVLVSPKPPMLPLPPHSKATPIQTAASMPSNSPGGVDLMVIATTVAKILQASSYC